MLKDHADKKWLSQPLVLFPEENWLLSPSFSPKPDPTADAEFELRAQKAWKNARATGKLPREL